MIPKAKDSKPLRAEPRTPLLVVIDSTRMLITVELDDDLPIKTDEVNDEPADGRLLTKLEPAELLAAQF
jgi:hypothetical protein